MYKPPHSNDQIHEIEFIPAPNEQSKGQCMRGKTLFINDKRQSDMEGRFLILISKATKRV